jgi:predicted transposase YdaD
MVLTVLPKKKVAENAKAMLSRSETTQDKSAILDLVSTIMINRFTTLSRDEVNKMLGIQLKESKVYQEAKTEGSLEEATKNALILLNQKLGALDDITVTKINVLSLEQLRFLICKVLDFETMADLQNFLQSLS